MSRRVGQEEEGDRGAGDQGSHRHTPPGSQKRATLAVISSHLEVLGLAVEARLLQAVSKPAAVAVAARPRVVAHHGGHLQECEGLGDRQEVGQW